MRSLSLLCVLALLFSGCLGAGPDDQDGPDETPTFAFQDPVPVRSPCPDCFEPAVAIDDEGRIYVVAHRLGGVAVSTDGGDTFEIKSVPRPDSPLESAGGASDDVIQVAPWGTAYYTQLWSDGGGLAGAGVHIAATDDGGDTWPLNVFVHTREMPTSGAVTSDRQWLAFEGDSTVYLVYNCLASILICSLRSDDRGATFDPAAIVVTPMDHSFPAPAGMPFVDQDDYLVVPYFADPELDGNIGARSVAVAVSSDGGQTFRQSKVYTHAAGTGHRGGGWPEATFLANGSWAAGWSDAERALHLSFSEDKGMSWSEPLVVPAQTAGNASTPWLFGGRFNHVQPGVDAVWFGSGPTVHLGRFVDGQPPQFATVPMEGGGQSDYPFFTHLPDGRVATVFLTPDGDLMYTELAA